MHAYPIGKGCFTKPKRSRKDFRFIAPTVEEAVQWVASFADQQCFINCLPHPLVSKKQGSSELFSVPIDTPPELVFRCKSAPKMLVILNPRSGHGRSIKVFHDVVEPIFKVPCPSFLFYFDVLVYIITLFYHFLGTNRTKVLNETVCILYVNL